ncbi:MAG: glycoside hydrolase family 16 protein, partial [Pseudomonadota bacterium]
MRKQLEKCKQLALLCSALLLVTACESDRSDVLSQVETGTDLLLFDNSAITPGGQMTLVWSDEFDGSGLDPATWLTRNGDGSEVGLPGGWGNNELQYYQPDNVEVANGLLVITAREESVGGLNYTSARITTADRVAFRYGRIEARMRLPGGQGVWPAFWLLSQNSPYGSWAAVGEIDVMEAINLGVGGLNEVFGTIHFGGEFPENQFTSQTQVVATSATDEFHTYALEWDPTEMRWYVDGVLYRMENSWFSTAAPYPAPFDQAFRIIFNVA